MVPPSWFRSPGARKPLELLSAELFNRSYTPSPDAYLHVARLRAAPTMLLVAGAVIGGLFAWFTWLLVAGMADMTGGERVAAIMATVLFGLLGLFFLFVTVNLITAAISRRSWANRQCIAFGRSGIALRLQGAAIDIPWDEITAIDALDVGSRDRGSIRKVSVLHIERGLGHWDLNPVVLDASPAVTYAVLRDCWLHPERRGGLGTVQAHEAINALVNR